jgi:hypothetical protein
MPGSVGFIVQPLIVLVLYLAAATWMTSHVSGARAVALSIGSSFGLLTAAVQILHLSIEGFVSVLGSLAAVTTLGFMFGTFLLWGWRATSPGEREDPGDREPWPGAGRRWSACAFSSASGSR